MSLLKDFKEHDRYIEINRNKQYIYSSELLSVIGWFYEFEDNLSSLYIEDGVLIFSFNDNLIPICSSVTVNLSKPLLIESSLRSKKFQREFRMYEKTGLFRRKLLLSFKYNIGEFYQLTMEEEEDFDWGLFVANIVNSKERRKSIIKYFKILK